LAWIALFKSSPFEVREDSVIISQRLDYSLTECALRFTMDSWLEALQ
jgi:hypothetical protein